MTRVLLSTLCAIVALMEAAGAQQPVFKSGVDAVRVDVAVTRGGPGDNGPDRGELRAA